MTHIMIDLETLDVEASAVVTSIGVAVGLDGGGMDLLDLRISDWGNQIKRGRTIDGETVKWWLQQSDAARASLIETNTTTALALQELTLMVKRYPKHQVWGNGASFDLSILRSLYKDYDLPCPWHFRDESCFRTMRQMVKVSPPQEKGVAHRAVDDAIFQLAWLEEMLKVAA
jgi:hypothetical protein